MKKIGVMFGMENTFPLSLIERINSKTVENVYAEILKTGGVYSWSSSPYDVIIDRISHDIPFYRSLLRSAAFLGSYVINNPFWSSADDKFFGMNLAPQIGITVPKTVLLPSKEHPPGTSSDSMRNLLFPLLWDNIFSFVGFPSYLKPFDKRNRQKVQKIYNVDEFFYYYNQSGDKCMMLQEGIEYESYYRSFCIGKRDVRILPYAPNHPIHTRYLIDYPDDPPALLEQMHTQTIAINTVLGYDINTVEFAIRENKPYAIDFLNPVPECDYHTITPPHFEWILETVAQFAIECALMERKPIDPKDMPRSLFRYRT